MAAAQFDLEAGKLNFASIGNIEARLLGSNEQNRFIVRRGIVGINMPMPVVTEHRWNRDSVLVMHSDGLSTHWDWRDFPAVMWSQPADAAQNLLKHLGQEEDDATVIVVTSKKI